MPELSKSQQDLAALMDRVFADGKVEPSEGEELRSFWATRGLTVSQVRAVVDAFVARVWGEVVADGVITDEEQAKLRAVVSGLRLPDGALPDPVRKALAQ
jgi:tellurite resistance protein